MRRIKSYFGIALSMVMLIVLFGGCGVSNSKSIITMTEAEDIAISAVDQKAEERFGHIDTFSFGVPKVSSIKEDYNFYYVSGCVSLRDDVGLNTINFKVEISKTSKEALVTYFI